MDEHNGEMQPIVSGELNTNVYQGIRNILAEARTKASTAVNTAMVEAYWDIGRQIEEAVGNRAEYGKGLLQFLSQGLTAEFGKGFTERNLRAMRQFYVAFPIRHTVCAELSWSHYRLLIRMEDNTHREFYAHECAQSGWSVRQLERQINSFYYERLLATQKSGKESVRNEVFKLDPSNDPAYMPEAFIIERHKYDRKAYEAYLADGGTRKLKVEDIERCGDMTNEWRRKYADLTPKQKEQVEPIIYKNVFTDEAIGNVDSAVREVLQYYHIKRYEEIPEVMSED